MCNDNDRRFLKDHRDVLVKSAKWKYQSTLKKLFYFGNVTITSGGVLSLET